jgi:hypothetical protein
MTAARGREVNLEQLLGRPVRALNGRPAGRIEELRAEKRGAGHVVTEFVLGPGGLLERMAISFRRTYLGRPHHGQVARWDQLDLDDPEHPRLTCTVDELREA